VTLEAAERFAAGLAFGLLALEIRAGGRVHARLCDGDRVQSAVELTAAFAVEARRCRCPEEAGSGAAPRRFANPLFRKVSAGVTSCTEAVYSGGVMSLGDERAAKNEALFRQVNERVEDLHEQLESGGKAEFVCECADGTCTEQIALSLVTYQRVRSDPYLFVLAPGHERKDLEQVVERGDGFVIVRKDTPTAAGVVAQTDPRS
jgi:hypothetical protein